MAVGAIEPQFYRLLLKGLGLAEDDLPAQLDMEEWPILREKFKQIFGSKVRFEDVYSKHSCNRF